PEEFPYRAPSGLVYVSGQYEAALDRALAMVDYKRFRDLQRRARDDGRHLGIGFSTFMETAGVGPSKTTPIPGWESATVRVETSGKITVLTGTSPHGQGLETAFAQIVADRLGVAMDDVAVLHGDTAIVAAVEVDLESGAVRLLRLVAVDDCGRVINPLLVEGQIHGGLAQGIGQALWEHMAYDELGQCLTASLMDYAVPKADALPSWELDRIETPSPVNPLGVKGCGEAGTIGSVSCSRVLRSHRPSRSSRCAGRR